MDSNESGFTVLEVLVAFVILASALGVVYQMVAMGGLRSDRAQKEQTALLLAKSKLADAMTIGRSTEGQEGNYHWELEWQALPVKEPRERRNPVRLAQVTVTVSWGEAGQEIRLATLRPEVQN
ncbi:type IV pilus modification PilV family protein [Emcibacter nanhaiensis]|nr:prepilin-type N-terminal cleavage/methylation domain-containing protein [Emcibacter nanhaiensis]